MGERYDGWVKDPVAGSFLKQKKLDKLPGPAADALEALADPTLRTCKQYGITRKAARETIFASTGLQNEPLRKFIQGLQNCTTDRIDRSEQIYRR